MIPPLQLNHSSACSTSMNIVCIYFRIRLFNHCFMTHHTGSEPDTKVWDGIGIPLSHPLMQMKLPSSTNLTCYTLLLSQHPRGLSPTRKETTIHSM
ncbi:hypothetical protein TNCT_341391 [Trichonephila clavata]|uniref:Uncharacterized protein n=1 Tax=Trichonephila clavata TaxID=2740835 RepID=A0A8X6KES6_TRICU|nr:hypothetical protein TNCT_341391 [Trichonephila clavata]